DNFHRGGQRRSDATEPGIFVPDAVADHAGANHCGHEPAWCIASCASQSVPRDIDDAGGKDADGRHGKKVYPHGRCPVLASCFSMVRQRSAPLSWPIAACIVRTTTNAS